MKLCEGCKGFFFVGEILATKGLATISHVLYSYVISYHSCSSSFPFFLQ